MELGGIMVALRLKKRCADRNQNNRVMLLESMVYPNVSQVARRSERSYSSQKKSKFEGDLI
jgi:hypothetical protein